MTVVFTITTKTADPMGAHACIESGRAEAAQWLGAQPSEIQACGSINTAHPDPANPANYTFEFVTTWGVIPTPET